MGGVWSADEQKKLEEALRQFPAALGKERFVLFFYENDDGCLSLYLSLSLSMYTLSLTIYLSLHLSLSVFRWTKIAEHVKTKSRKECIDRFKELAQLVKSKKVG